MFSHITRGSQQPTKFSVQNKSNPSERKYYLRIIVVSIALAISACGGGDAEEGGQLPTGPGGTPIDPISPSPDSYHEGYTVRKPDGVSDAQLKAVPEIMMHTIGKPQKGEYSIDSSGMLNYSYKIVVPPAINGDGPEIGVSYAGAAAGGDLQTGWSITGISSIEKCRATKAKDGFISPVTSLGSSESRYCLDGKPLILVSGAVYGEDGSEYVTEVMSDVRVKAFGSTIYGPEYFESKSGDGKTVVYGSKTESRVTDFRDKSVHGWLQESMTDGSGNTISYEYNDWDQIEFIWYQGKTENANTVRIHFSWEQSTSLSQVWVTPDEKVHEGLYTDFPLGTPSKSNGAALASSKGRLSRISTSVAATRVAHYEFTYEPLKSKGQGPTNNLESIRYCSGFPTFCSEPIVFSWEYQEENKNSLDSCGYNYANAETDLIGGMPAFSSEYKKSTPYTDDFGWENGNYYSQVLGDFNNDDLVDISVVYTFRDVDKSTMTARTAINKGDGTFSPFGEVYSATIGGFALNQRLSGDLNNDGYDDLIATNTSEKGWNIYTVINNGDGTFSAPEHQLVSEESFIDDRSFKQVTGDFNGDGFIDLLTTVRLNIE